MTKTEKQVCDTFIQMMKEKPYSSIKVAELTREAGISRSTFYVYFDSIEDVLQAVEDEFLSHLADEKDVYTNYNLTRVAGNFSYVRDHMEIYETLTGPNGDPYFATRIGNRSKRVFYNMVSEKNSPLPDAKLAMINEYNQAGKMQVFRWWGEHKNEVSVNDIIETLDKLERAIHDIVIGKL